MFTYLDAAMTPRLSANGHEGHETVMEGDQVHFRCESDGRPIPNVSINNDDIDAAVFEGSSNISYTVIARCEDTATYTCSAWNQFSRHVTTSHSLMLEVKCKFFGKNFVCFNVLFSILSIN